jgi:hypothetical protein
MTLHSDSLRHTGFLCSFDEAILVQMLSKIAPKETTVFQKHFEQAAQAFRQRMDGLSIVAGSREVMLDQDVQILIFYTS